MVDEHAGAEVWLSVLIVGKLRGGVELIARRDKKPTSKLRVWLDSTVKDYAGRILPVTVGSSSAGATLGPRPGPD